MTFMCHRRLSETAEFAIKSVNQIQQYFKVWWKIQFSLSHVSNQTERDNGKKTNKKMSSDSPYTFYTIFIDR